LGIEHLDACSMADWRRDYLRFNYWLVHDLKPAVMVELGVYAGWGCAHLAAGNPDGRVHGVDLDEHPKFWDVVGPWADRITLTLANSITPEAQVGVEDDSVGFMFCDSVHSWSHVMEELRMWTPKLMDGAVIVCDDLDWDDGMRGLFDHLPYEEKVKLPEAHSGTGMACAIVRK
jgi:predicted O-methyltransferase YrrM